MEIEYKTVIALNSTVVEISDSTLAGLLNLSERYPNFKIVDKKSFRLSIQSGLRHLEIRDMVFTVLRLKDHSGHQVGEYNISFKYKSLGYKQGKAGLFINSHIMTKEGGAIDSWEVKPPVFCTTDDIYHASKEYDPDYFPIIDTVEGKIKVRIFKC